MARKNQVSRTAPPSYKAARWFLDDCVKRFSGRLALISLVSFASAGLQGTSLAMMHRAVSGSLAKLPIDLPALGLDPDMTIPAAVVLVISALLLSAAFIYVQGLLVLRFWQAYQIHSVNRVFEAIRNAVARGVNAAAIEDAPVTDVLRQSQRLGAFTRVVGSSIVPVLRFLAFGTVAVMANPFLTFVLLLVMVPSAGLALLHFARRSSRSSRRAIALSGDAGKELDNVLRAAFDGGASATISDRGTKPSPFVEKIRATTGRILYVEQAKFTAGFIAMASLGIFIGYEFVTAPEDKTVWSSTLIYALALLLAFRQLVNVSSSISSFGRFYPAVQAQQELVEALEGASSAEEFTARIKRSSLGNIVVGSDMLDDEL